MVCDKISTGFAFFASTLLDLTDVSLNPILLYHVFKVSVGIFAVKDVTQFVH